MKNGAMDMDMADAHSESCVDAEVPKSCFVTTSDVLKQLNRQLSDLSTYDSNRSIGQEQKPRFELQTRLPDGSTIPATKDEIAAADFKTKLEQSAQFISKLESSEDRQRWAEQQRLSGNKFFKQGQIREAMDIYLTCLVVKEDTPDFVRETFLPVLNNLAQCTLQLGMHTKTILFCEMALEEVAKAKKKFENDEGKRIEDEAEEQQIFLMQRDLSDSVALCKILFKLAKALRLTGHYEKARKTLGNSLDYLIGKENEIIASPSLPNDDGANAEFSLEPYKKAIKKEFQCLHVAEKEARRNSARQKLAMQTVMSPSLTMNPNNASAAVQGKHQIQEEHSFSDSLYENAPRPRQFSKLRARKYESVTIGNNDCVPENISYTQYYWSMVARVAKALLVMMGETEDIQNKEFPKPTKKKNN